MSSRHRDAPLPRTLFGLDAQRLRRGLSALVPGRDVSSVQPVVRASSPLTTFAVQLDRDGHLVRGERDWQMYTGQAEQDALGEGFLIAVHPDERTSFRTLMLAQLGAGRPFVCTTRIFARTPGQHRSCQLAAAPLPGSRSAWLLIVAERVASDVTEQEGRLQASARELELLRTLAEGLLHIINNALQGAVGYTALLYRGHDEWTRLAAERIDDSLARITCAGKKLVSATADARLRLALSDLGSSVREWEPELAALCPPGAHLELRASPGQTWVHSDPQTLAEALMHVVRNAAEALEASGARILVTIGQRSFLAQELAHAEPPRLAHDGEFAFIEVVDDGAGIAPAHLARVFDPFFSTKFIGRGLGLSITRGLMRQLGGLVSLTSMPGRGTRVLLLLPAAERPAC
jgi:two-component system cell cycle sensor histidine kinase/response regulator CckA